MTIEKVAELCHEVNRAYCAAIGDNSQKPWAEAQDWQKASALNGVAYELANPNSSQSRSHDAWLKEKTDAGWKYGPAKDAAKKEHPCCVPYEKLPEEEKAKDALFSAVVNSVRPLVTK